MNALTAVASAVRQERLRHVLCAVDLSDVSAPLLAHAVALATRFDARVTALHVRSVWVPPASLTEYPGAAVVPPLAAQQAIDNELASLTAPYQSGPTPVAVHTIDGDAAAEIVRTVSTFDVDLIVLGTHGRTGFDRLALGSVAEKVLRKATCPVLTLPPGAPRAGDDRVYHRILCPIDFSASSVHALDFARSLSRRIGAALTALHVVEALDGGDEPTRDDFIGDIRRRQCDMARASLREFVGPQDGDAPAIEQLIVLGRPHREIVRLAEERSSDLIVMGVRGRGALGLTLFGSTTNQVVRRATCPVATIRERL